MKAGERYEAESGRGFTVIAVSASVVTVEVERVVRRGSGHKVERRRREVSHNAYETFSRAYSLVK